MKTAWIVAAALVSLAVSATGFAQEFPKPGPEHEALKTMEGTWEATMKPAEGGEFPGEMTAKMECGGMWLASDYKTDFGGLKFSGKGLDGYDTTKKKYVSVWVDSMSTTPMMLEGNFNDEKQLVMTGSSVNMEGKPIKVKTVSKMNSEDSHSFEMFELKDDGSEKSMFTIEYKRKK
jgi:hypothetical protein